MKHCGDIKRLHGEQLEPVDIIIGGSPCQNLSVAGNRQGLSGEQSSLFLEQIRVVKESRKYHGKPRFMLWENVPGALTSSDGEDFRKALEETVRIKEESVSIPRPEKWANAGCIVGDGFSVAWRIHDAQYWGVPQRRRRIALVADFDGQCAGEILFEPKGLRGDSQKSKETKQEAAGTVDRGIDADHQQLIYSFDSLSRNSMKSANPNSGCRRIEIARTLDASVPDPSKNQGGVAVVEAFGFKGGQAGGDVGLQADCMPTLTTATSGPEPTILTIESEKRIFDTRGNGDGKLSPTNTGDHNNRVTDYTAVVITQNSFIDIGMNIAPTVISTDYKRPCAVSYTDNVKYNIRRLTPLECERLQGYPDGWTDIGEWKDTKGKTHKASDTVRYKALGNSIALPFWHWLLNRFAPYLPESPTMGSLFDGIGGFPLCWERIYGKGAAVWASEIEPFCIAVTERRFNNIT